MKQEEWKTVTNGFKISHSRYPIFSAKVENKTPPPHQPPPHQPPPPLPHPPFHSLEEEAVLPNYNCCGHKNSAELVQPLSRPLQQRPNNVPETNDLFKVSDRNTTKRFEKCSKSTIKIPEPFQFLILVFFVNFESISHPFSSISTFKFERHISNKI